MWFDQASKKRRRIVEDYDTHPNDTERPDHQRKRPRTEKQDAVLDQDTDVIRNVTWAAVPAPQNQMPVATTDAPVQDKLSEHDMLQQRSERLRKAYEEEVLQAKGVPEYDPFHTGEPSEESSSRAEHRDYRMPSRYYRYMSVARQEPYGRVPSMSRWQSRRYEEQRRRIDQQGTPQPNAEPEYEPIPSREHSVDQVSLDDRYDARHAPREYVSVQDRLHSYSPPRYRYYERRQSPYDEHGYPVSRLREEPRYRVSPVPDQQHARYEPERDEYLTEPDEQPTEHSELGYPTTPNSMPRTPAQYRYDSHGEHVAYEERHVEYV